MKKSTKSIILNFIIMTGNGVIATAAGRLLREGAKEKDKRKIAVGLALTVHTTLGNYLSGRDLGEAITERYLEREETKKVTTVE